MRFTTDRIQAFSDGVFAIAITLLVLDLRVPPREGTASLAHALGHEWPSYAAYAVSFLVIGIIWINHHQVMDAVRSVDRPVMFANLALLGVVSAIPFPTRMLAEYLTAGWDGSVAAAIYGATMLAMSVAFTVLWLVVTRERAGLLAKHLDPGTARRSVVRFGVGFVVYLVAILVAFASAPAALVLHGLIAIYYTFDQLRTPSAEASPAR
jgi:TMEM175 potassium channel family protein